MVRSRNLNSRWCIPAWGGKTKQIHDYTTGQHRLKVLLLFSSVLPSWIVNSGLVRLLWVQGASQVKMPTRNLEIPTSGLIWNAPLNPSGGLSPLEVDIKVVAPLSITRVINCGSTTSDSSQSVKKKRHRSVQWRVKPLWDLMWGQIPSSFHHLPSYFQALENYGKDD